MSILVTGGAGYIGSHMVKMLKEANFHVTVFDNLSRGFRDAVLCEDFIQGDLCNLEDLKKVFQERKFESVIHFAAFAYVGESVIDPLSYYENNVNGTLNLLNEMLDVGVKQIVFSSTCATYGIPDEIPILETTPQNPINPYGRTKFIIENILSDYAYAYELNSISLRYFNAAGCDPEGQLGERHEPETHLIPLVLHEAKRILAGGNPNSTELRVFGDDFDTPDGTCIRDYIHVADLCNAHMVALRLLKEKSVKGFNFFNLGNGAGYSVKEVIESCRKVTGVDIQYKVIPRRFGDPPVLVGSAEKAKSKLGWQPQFANLDEIIETAWDWIKGCKLLAES